MRAEQWNQQYEQQKQQGQPTRITSAYNFVPLSDHIVFPDWADKVSHDKPFADGLSGTLNLQIKNHSPLLVGEQEKGEVKPYRLPDDTFAIAGSSLRGMIRNVLEIASFGKMRYVDDKRYGVRDLQAGFYKKKFSKDGSSPGWLNFKDNQWRITPCRMVRVKHLILEQYLGRRQVKLGNIETAEEKYEEWLKAGKSLTIKFFENSISQKEIDIKQQGDIEGSLVFTGQPNLAKKRDFIFFSENSAEEFVIPSQVMQDFQHIYKASQHWDYLKEKKLFSQGIPVFYLKEKNSKISSMGLSQMYRLAYKNSIGDLIDKVNKEHRANNHLDLAEVIFGTVDEDDGQESLKGRVSFSHAQCETKNPQQTRCEAILSSPKPTYYPNYIEQNEENGKLKGTEYQTFMDDKAKIRGWKRYPVRPSEQIAIPELSDKVRKKTDPDKRVWVVLHPIIEAVSFTATLRFHNLRPIELGALAWCLSWGNNDSLKHAIGSGKSFGFGQISINITADDIRPNKLENVCSIERCIEQFIAFMDQQTAQDWIYSEQIQQLMAMANPEAAKEKDEALIPLDLDGGGRGNQFVNAKKVNPPLVLKQYSKIKPAVLSADRVWLEQTLTEIEKKDNSPRKDVICAKGLATQWQAIDDPRLKQQVKTLIKQQWGDWWHEPNGKSMKKAHKIYQENDK